MVGPIPDDERRSAMFRLKAGLVAVIGLSAGLITLRGGAPPAVIAAAVAGGLGIGAALVWFVFPGSGEVRRRPRR